MKKNVRVISLALAALLLVSACFCITGCKKHEVKMTEKNNGLYDYEEVRQINETLRMPYHLGTREAAFGSEFESYGGIPDHAEIFRSKDNLDITYTLTALHHRPCGSRNKRRQQHRQSQRKAAGGRL